MLKQPRYIFVQMPNQTLRDILMQSIRQSAKAIELYNNLLKQASDEFNISLLNNILASEIRTMDRLKTEYQQNFGPVPSYAVEPADTAFSSFIEGLLLAFTNNNQSINFEREVLDRMQAQGIGFQLYMYLLINDMAQQNLLNTLYTYNLYQTK